MNPNAINDNALNKRLGDYPTLGMTPLQAVTVFPDWRRYAVAWQGAAPADPLLNALKGGAGSRAGTRSKDRKKVDGTGAPRPEPTDAEKAAQKDKDKVTRHALPVSCSRCRKSSAWLR